MTPRNGEIVTVWVDAGSRNETAANNGVAHLMETSSMMAPHTGVLVGHKVPGTQRLSEGSSASAAAFSVQRCAMVAETLHPIGQLCRVG